MEGSGTSRLLVAEGMNHGHERCSTGTIDRDIVACMVICGSNSVMHRLVESLCCVPETSVPLCVNNTLIRKKSDLKKIN